MGYELRSLTHKDLQEIKNLSAEDLRDDERAAREDLTMLAAEFLRAERDFAKCRQEFNDASELATAFFEEEGRRRVSRREAALEKSDV